jgi:hypothetical protein
MTLHEVYACGLVDFEQLPAVADWRLIDEHHVRDEVIRPASDRTGIYPHAVLPILPCSMSLQTKDGVPSEQRRSGVRFSYPPQKGYAIYIS